MWSSLLSIFITFYSLVRPVFNFPFVLYSFSASLMLASTSTARLYFLLCFQLLILLSCCNWFTFSICASFNCPFLFISHFSLQFTTTSRLSCAFLMSPSFACFYIFYIFFISSSFISLVSLFLLLSDSFLLIFVVCTLLFHSHYRICFLFIHDFSCTFILLLSVCLSVICFPCFCGPVCIFH